MVSADDFTKELYEFNAKALVTTWGSYNQAESGGLKDYSNRQWSGLIGDFYKPRWERWITARSNELNGKSYENNINWFQWEWEWVRSNTEYTTKATPADLKTLGLEIVEKYTSANPAADAKNDYPADKITATAGTLELSEGSLEALFDGNPSSFYHSNWSGTKPTEEDFWIVMELEEITEVAGVRYLPRQSSPNGRILGYEISCSLDGKEWTKVAEGTWADDESWKMVGFDAVEAKYVKIFATNSKSDNNGRHMTGAELRVVLAVDEPEVTPTPEVTEAPNPTEVPKPTETPETTEDVKTVFSDVYKDWYTEYVQYVYDNGLMTGIKGTTQFQPNANITKAQVAQVLYNMDGQPAVTDKKVFGVLNDVYAGEWYANAVAWAYSTGVVTGDTNTKKFNPNADVTREQLALMMYRYADYKKYDVTASSDLAGLKNAENTANWALAGVKWAVGKGLISGIEKNGVKDLAPQGNASRAQVAAILQRFCEAYK